MQTTILEINGKEYKIIHPTITPENENKFKLFFTKEMNPSFFQYLENNKLDLDQIIISNWDGNCN